MRAYSEDLRKRIVAGYERGERVPDLAAKYEVSESSVWRYVHAHRTGRSLTPLPRPGRPRRIERASEPLLEQQLQEHPDRTLVEHVELWAQRTGMRVSFKTMDRALSRLTITRKKRR